MENNQTEIFKILELALAPMLHNVCTAAIELNLFEIIAKAGPNAQLSAADIASDLPTENQEAPAMLDRMLRLLASHSILKCSLAVNKDGETTRLYGLTSICKFLVRNPDGISFAPHFLILREKAIRDCFYFLKDAVLEGGTPFSRAQGMHIFEYLGKNSTTNEVFNHAMLTFTTVTMREVLEKYKGFEGLKEIVDVGGGYGAALKAIISMYQGIKGTNFDLPCVIKDAPAYPGVEHIGGDMFEYIPKCEVILLKNILHDWEDDQCLKLLKNCWNALPESGKVIIIEMLLPESAETDPISRIAFGFDMGVMTFSHGGRERSEKEFHSLAREAGFASSKLVCHAVFFGVLEFYKT